MPTSPVFYETNWSGEEKAFSAKRTPIWYRRHRRTERPGFVRNELFQLANGFRPRMNANKRQLDYISSPGGPVDGLVRVSFGRSSLTFFRAGPSFGMDSCLLSFVAGTCWAQLRAAWLPQRQLRLDCCPLLQCAGEPGAAGWGGTRKALSYLRKISYRFLDRVRRRGYATWQAGRAGVAGPGTRTRESDDNGYPLAHAG